MEALSMQGLGQGLLLSALLCTASPSAGFKNGLEALQGSWDCEDHLGAMRLGSKLSVVATGNGVWKVHYDQEQNPQLDKPYRSDGVWSVLPNNGGYFRYIRDNFNGFDFGVTAGLMQNELLWKGQSEFFGQAYEYEGRFTVLDAKTYESRYRSRRQGTTEAWVETVWSECRRAAID